MKIWHLKGAVLKRRSNNLRKCCLYVSNIFHLNNVSETSAKFELKRLFMKWQIFTVGYMVMQTKGPS